MTCITPVENQSKASTPHQTRIIERAVFRPASAVGRPYDFIVESVEESTDLMQQVELYGSELLGFGDNVQQQQKQQQQHENTKNFN